MAKSIYQELLFLVLQVYLLIQSTIQDRSVSDFTDLGYEFVPADIYHPPLSTFTTKKRLYCYLECNKRIDCRTFDYDDTNKQCRLWDADTITTGSIVPSPSKPQSSVGTIRLSSDTYTNMHNQPCNKCSLSRYEICNMTSNTCQCPSNTFWNGSMCLAQLFRNQICSRADACRSDLNLTCSPSCDFTYRCLDTPAIGVGQTVAGFCNGTIGNVSTTLSGPWGIYVSPNDGTLYVSDWDFQTVQTFSTFSRTGHVILSTGLQRANDIFIDSSETIYMVATGTSYGLVYIQKAGINIGTIPPKGFSLESCALTEVWDPHGIVIDRSNNIYISLYFCHVVVEWLFNATSGTVFVGQLGVSGQDNNQLNFPRFMHLDEDRNALYVCDGWNHRVQKFIIGGNGTGVTVAGNGVAGTGLNQLNDPSGICVTSDGQTLFIADYRNSRLMKWIIGASQGSVITGNVNGVAGSTSQLLSYPGDVGFDPSETYVYVSDYGNHRVQRIRVR